MSRESYILKTLALLKLERDTEIAETTALHESLPPKELQRRGICLLKLRLGDKKSGLYGRSIVSFESALEKSDLPSNNFSPGDIAGVSTTQGSDDGSDILATGIVTRVTNKSISLAFDESFDNLDLDEDTSYKIVKVANDVTYRRLKKALDDLQTCNKVASQHLVDLLFEEAEPSEPLPPPSEDLRFFNNNLDDSQRNAVQFTICQRDVAIVHGPPGTGKTTTIVEIIRQAVKANQKVLACAPSNIAVDNLVERLGPHCKVVRLGHPARLLPGIQKHSLDAVLSASDEAQIVQDVRKDMDTTLASLHKTRDAGEKRSVRSRLKSLRQELRAREDRAVKSILQRAQVVLATLTGASLDGPLKLLDTKQGPAFDMVVIDENSQALEASCWIALPYAPRCVLAGDHLQLPPTIMSSKAAEEGLAVTLMERIIKLHKEKLVRMLTTQYRMHESIMKFSSEQLYEGHLTAHHSVAGHLLKDLTGVLSNEDTVTPLLLVDTAGCDLDELDLPDELSKGNEGEVELVKIHVENLISSGVQPADIAVIAPYNLQVDMLRLRLAGQYPTLEIKSVDGFQGREKEAVVISLVRSNSKGEVGFLAEDRRINVAITRAKRHLAVICDSVTVSSHEFLAKLVGHMIENGEVRSAHGYLTDDVVSGERLTIVDRQLDLAIHKVKQEEKKQASKQTSKKPSKPTKRKPPPAVHEDTGANTKDSSNQQKFEEHRVLEIQNEIDEFIKQEEERKHAFPSSLSSKDRHTVHKLCEVLGLLHISRGEGAERHIVIQKPASESEAGTETSSPKPAKHDKKTAHQVKQSQAEGSPEDVASDEKMRDKQEAGDEMVTCPDCGNNLPAQNMQLHSLWCQGQAVLSSSSPEDESHVTKEAKKRVRKKRNKKQAAQTIEDKIADADGEEAALETVIKENKRCSFPSCKQPVVTFNLWCSYCSKKFCSEHFLAEVHGCGLAAKQSARRTINRHGQLFPGSGVPDKKPNKVQRDQLKRKLDSKLNQLADRRKGKKPDNQ